MPTLLDASDGGGAAAHTVVEHRVALVGVGENEIAQQVNGLLGGVNAEVVMYFSALIIIFEYHSRIVTDVSHDGVFMRWSLSDNIVKFAFLTMLYYMTRL